MEENKMKERILLIDMWNICVGQNATTNILDSNSEPIGMYLGTMNMIRTAVDKFKPNKVVLAFDGPEAGERRRKIYPGYKAGRRVRAKTSVVTIQEDDDEETKFTSSEAFTNQLVKIYEFCKLLPVTTIMVPYCEGDDIISYLTIKNKDIFDVYIVSTDNDYLQLIDENVKVYNWRKKTLYNEKIFFDEYNITSKNYIYMKILLGDTSDEVKGVKGIGKGTFPMFHKMLNEAVYENVSDFVTRAKTIETEALKTRTKNALKNLFLEETVKEMFLLFQVMKLDENCLKLHHITMLREQVDEQSNKVLGRIISYAVMKRNHFGKLYNGFNPDKWIQPFAFVRGKEKINY